MVTCLVVGLLGPLALAWAYVAIPDDSLFDPVLKGGQAVLVNLSVLLVPLSILVSSSVDWYLIRSFREGVHGPPVCQAGPHKSGQAMAYAKYWILHRMASEFLVYAGILGLIAMISTIAGEATHSETGRNVLSLVGLSGGIAWTYSQLSPLKPALDFVRHPTCGLGEWVKGRNDQGDEISGFVLDVSVDPGIQLISEPRGRQARDISDPDSSVPLKSRRTIKPIQPPRTLCAEGNCEFWRADCEVGLRKHEESAGETSDTAS